METVKIIVKGIVQRVGYRTAVERVARKLKVKGYVKNLSDVDESVEIVAQAPTKETLDLFLHKINIKTELIEVQEINTQKREENEFGNFKILRGSYEEENAERLDVAAMHLDNLTKEVRNVSDRVDNVANKQDQTITAIKDLSVKQDNTITAIKDMNGNMTNRFDTLDRKYGKVSENLGEISKNLRELNDTLRIFKPKE